MRFDGDIEDDQAQLENYPLWNWQPVKIVTKCRCYSIELALYRMRDGDDTNMAIIASKTRQTQCSMFMTITV